jgi:hypothetical protein
LAEHRPAVEARERQMPDLTSLFLRGLPPATLDQSRLDGRGARARMEFKRDGIAISRNLVGQARALDLR